MKTMLMEVNTEKFELSTLDGKTYGIEPWDITICCTWTPTTEIEITTDKEQKYCINLSTNQKIRLK